MKKLLLIAAVLLVAGALLLVVGAVLEDAPPPQPEEGELVLELEDIPEVTVSGADGADAEPVDPADRDGETLIWQPDAETMVVLSFDWAGDTTRVVIWRTNEEFQIAIDTEQ